MTDDTEADIGCEAIDAARELAFKSLREDAQAADVDEPEAMANVWFTSLIVISLAQHFLPAGPDEPDGVMTPDQVAVLVNEELARCGAAYRMVRGS